MAENVQGTSGGNMVDVLREIASDAYPPTERPDIVFGVVKSVSPMQIEVESKFTIGEDFLVFSPFCFEYKIPKDYIDERDHTHTTGSATVGDHGSHNHPVNGSISGIDTITLWKGLESGDNVVMIRIANGQKYYVLHREGELQ